MYVYLSVCGCVCVCAHVGGGMTNVPNLTDHSHEKIYRLLLTPSPGFVRACGCVRVSGVCVCACV